MAIDNYIIIRPLHSGHLMNAIEEIKVPSEGRRGLNSAAISSTSSSVPSTILSEVGGGCRSVNSHDASMTSFQQSSQETPLVNPMLSHPNSTPRNERDDMDYNRKATRRRSFGKLEQDTEICTKLDIDTTTNASPNNVSKRSIPQQVGEETEIAETRSVPARDVDFELELLLQRNKRVLLSRLIEVAPRGKLSMINLCRRGIGFQEALLLKDAITRNPQLCVLKLSYNDLGDEGAAVIATSLNTGKGHHQLSVLDLGFNSIGDIGCGYLAVHCLAGNYNLQTLSLTGNQIGEKGALSIAGAILHGSALNSLYLSANQIGPIGTKTIAGAIAKNEAKLLSMREKMNGRPSRSIRLLHLDSTSMTSDGFLAIPGMLLTNTTLTSLCISDNNLYDHDIQLLSQALTQNKFVPLHTLQLSFNHITCVGVEYLMNALWGSQHLRELRLDNNEMKDRGAQLCAVFLTATALETLDISFNRVSTVGIKALMKNLSENNSLQNLGIAGIAIDQNASKAVSYALAYNTSLRAFHVDNRSSGYASQRHIVAGVVSNRKSCLRILTGFHLSPIARTLGMNFLPEEWSNDQVLGFFRLMWDQWLLKSRQGNSRCDDDIARGPAPPAVVAAAAKIAFASLGTRPQSKVFQTEQHEKQLSERAPVEPAGSALLERSDSGTMRVPIFTVSSEIGLTDFVDGESKVAAAVNNTPSRQHATVRSPLDNPERRNYNLQWLRLHFRSLSEVGRLPFNNADLWQLHQYYFSPPLCNSDDEDMEAKESSTCVGTQSMNDSASRNDSTISGKGAGSSFDRTVSYQSLSDAMANSNSPTNAISHKRRSHDAPGKHASKRLKNLKARIAYYPRIMAKIQSLGTRPTLETLSLLRQLKYAESVVFADRDPYEQPDISSVDLSHSDIDMILLDLI